MNTLGLNWRIRCCCCETSGFDGLLVLKILKWWRGYLRWDKHREYECGRQRVTRGDGGFDEDG
jgi:hypothetical protein